MYRKFLFGGIFCLHWAISAVYAANSEFTADEMFALWNQRPLIRMVAGRPNVDQDLDLADQAKKKVSADSPLEASARLDSVHRKLGEGDSLLVCIDEIEGILGPDHRSLAEKLRILLALVGQQETLFTIIERFRVSLGGEGSLDTRIKRILAIIGDVGHVTPALMGKDGIVIPELEYVLSRLGFGKSMHSTIDKAIDCIGGEAVSVFANIVAVKKLVGGEGALTARIQSLYDLIPGEGTLVTQVQQMKTSLEETRAEVQAMEETLRQKETVFLATQQDVAEKEAELLKEKAALTTLQKEKEAAEAALSTQAATFEEERTTWTTKQKELDARIAALEHQVRDLERSLEIKKKALETSQLEKTHIHQQLLAKEEEVATLTARLQAEAGKSNQLQLDLEENTRALQEAEADADRLRTHLEAKQLELDTAQATARQLTEDLSALEREKAAWTTLEARLTETLETHEKALEEAQKSLSESLKREEVLTEQNRHLTDEVETLTKKITRLEEQVGTLSKSKAAALAQLEVVRTEKEALEARVATLTTEKQAALQRATKAEKELAEANELAALLQAEIDDLKLTAQTAREHLGMPLASLESFNAALGAATVREGVQALGVLVGVEADMVTGAEAAFSHVIRLLNGGVNLKKNRLTGVDSWVSLRAALLDMCKREVVNEVRSEMGLSPVPSGSEGETSGSEDDGTDKKEKKKKKSEKKK